MSNICKYCKSRYHVFLEAKKSPDKKEYEIIPICINCKNKQIKQSDSDYHTKSVLSWEISLKKIERQISKEIVENIFPEIKFKKTASEKIEKLMKKYPIRKIFETFALDSNSKFSIPEIEKNCNLG